MADPGAASSSASSASLLDRALASEPAAKKRRTLAKQDTDAAVTKSLADNFKNFSATQIDATMINGLTLRQQLAEDKRRHKENPKAFPMGQKYYAAMRSAYSSAEDPQKQLQVKDATLGVNAQLLKAMVALKAKQPNRQPMLGYLHVAEVPNQKELCGILKWGLELRPSASPEQLRCCLDLMRYVARLGLHKLFPDELLVMQAHFDETLVQAFKLNMLP